MYGKLATTWLNSRKLADDSGNFEKVNRLTFSLWGFTNAVSRFLMEIRTRRDRILIARHLQKSHTYDFFTMGIC